MKIYQTLLALVTIFTLAAIDGQAASEDGLLAYGLALRGVVWLIIAANAVVLYEGVRAYAAQED